MKRPLPGVHGYSDERNLGVTQLEVAEVSDRAHFERPDVRQALEDFGRLEAEHQDGEVDSLPDVNEFLAERGLTPPSGAKLVRENIIMCPPGYRPVPVGPPPRFPPPFCTCERI